MSPTKRDAQAIDLLRMFDQLVILNLVLSGAGLWYLIKVETRFARLEVMMKVVMRQYQLIDADEARNDV